MNQAPVRADVGTGTLDLALRIIELLADEPRPVALTRIAATFGASKATVYRHLATLARHGFVRQDPATGRYEVGLKLMVLGERSRDRFDVARAARDELLRLRDRTGQAATLCTLVDNDVVVVELVQGHSVIEFGTRPGTRLSLHASAHGKVWLAFGPDHLWAGVEGGGLTAWTPQTLVDAERLQRDVERVRSRGWSSAPNEVVLGVNAIAAPVFGHRRTLLGSLAIVGATQFIPEEPPDEQIGPLLATADRISASLGFKS